MKLVKVIASAFAMLKVYSCCHLVFRLRQKNCYLK